MYVKARTTLRRIGIMSIRIVAVAIQVLLGIVVVFIPNSASAEPHTHDGFYARGELGMGYLSRWGTTSYSGDSEEYSLSGPGFVSLGVFLGGTPLPGFAVGGSAIVAQSVLPDSEYTNPQFGGCSCATAVSVVGPFVQYYPFRDGGFNVGLVFGLAAIHQELFKGSGAHTGVGFSLSMGYEAWIGQELSLGIAARLTRVLTWASEEWVSEDQHHYKADTNSGAMAPGLVISFSYH